MSSDGGVKISQLDKVPEAITFMGVQANGKSTFFQQSFARDFVHINLDSLYIRTRETKLPEECLKQRASSVVDNTDPTAGDRKRYIQAARESDCEVEGYFFQSLAKDCIQWSSRRLGKACVPDKAIAYTSNQLEMPTHDEGSDRLCFICIRDRKFRVDEWENQYFNRKER